MPANNVAAAPRFEDSEVDGQHGITQNQNAQDDAIEAVRPHPKTTKPAKRPAAPLPQAIA